MRSTGKLHLTPPFIVLALVASPFLATVVAFFGTIPENAWQEVTYRPFLDTIGRSVSLFLVSGCLAVALGWPLGTTLSLFDFRSKPLCLLGLLLPITLPPFILAIGIQSLKRFTSFRHEVWFDGFSGCVQSYLLILIPLVALTTLAASRSNHKSEIEFSLLSGGPGPAFLQLMRSTLPSAIGAGTFGVLLLLSDSGSGQLMGVHGIARELLIEFSANHNLAMATLKAMTLLILTAPAAVIAAILISRSFSGRSDSREKLFRTFPLNQLSPTFQRSTASYVFALCLALPLISFFGIISPLVLNNHSFGFSYAFKVFRESVGISFFYATSSAAVSCSLAMFAVYFLPQNSKPGLKRLIMVISLTFFAFPSMISALGINWFASHLPEQLDPVFRGPLLVPIGCGLRYTPVAILFLLPAWEKIPEGRRDSLLSSPAGVATKVFKVFLPALRIPIVAAFSLTALLSLSDATSLVFLQPPGLNSFSSHLFAMMDNTPRQVIAFMCLLYFLIPTIFLGASGLMTYDRSR